MLDLPHGATLEDTDRMLMTAAERLKTLPELVSIQPTRGRPRPSTLMVLFATTICARIRSRAISRSIFCQRASGRARAMRSRSTSGAGSRICRYPTVRR